MSDECFVISPIGEAGSPVRRHADHLIKHIIEPAVKLQDYEVSRADRFDEPGVITSQIIQRLANAPLVIADLTEQNPNVLYEIAIRHAVHLPIIHMARSGEKLPFDIAGFRTIFFDLSDLDSVSDSRTALTQQLVNLKEKSFESPISIALNLKKLEESASPQDRMLADILAEITELRSLINSAESSKAQAERDNQSGSMFNQRYLEYLRKSLLLSNIVGKNVKLSRAGREWKGLSPFVKEKTPSFYVNDAKQFYHCFASGKHGDIFVWFTETLGITFPEAVIEASKLKKSLQDNKSYGLEDNIPF